MPESGNELEYPAIRPLNELGDLAEGAIAAVNETMNEAEGFGAEVGVTVASALAEKLRRISDAVGIMTARVSIAKPPEERRQDVPEFELQPDEAPSLVEEPAPDLPQNAEEKVTEGAPRPNKVKDEKALTDDDMKIAVRMVGTLVNMTRGQKAALTVKEIHTALITSGELVDEIKPSHVRKVAKALAANGFAVVSMRGKTPTFLPGEGIRERWNAEGGLLDISAALNDIARTYRES